MADEVDESIEELSEGNKSEETEIIDPIKVLESKVEELEKEKQYSTAEMVNLRQRYAKNLAIIARWKYTRL